MPGARGDIVESQTLYQHSKVQSPKPSLTDFTTVIVTSIKQQFEVVVTIKKSLKVAQENPSEKFY